MLDTDHSLQSDMPLRPVKMPRCVTSKYATWYDDETGLPKYEVRIFDIHTDRILAAGSFAEMSVWLRDHKYQWVTGSNGLWYQ